MTDSFSSRWWYGIIPIPVLPFVVSILWAGIRTLSVAAPGTDPTQLVPRSQEAFVLEIPFLLGTLTAIVVWNLLAFVYAICLFMDSRAIRRGDFAWEPNQYFYGLLGAIHVGAILLPYLYVVSIPAAVVYLVQRHRYVGTP